jgi:hypothetical protein
MSMSELGQSRRFCDVGIASGSPPRTDSINFGYFFRKVRKTDMHSLMFHVVDRPQ